MNPRVIDRRRYNEENGELVYPAMGETLHFLFNKGRVQNHHHEWALADWTDGDSTILGYQRVVQETKGCFKWVHTHKVWWNHPGTHPPYWMLCTETRKTLVAPEVIEYRRKRDPETGEEIIPENGEIEVHDTNFKALADFDGREWTLATMQLTSRVVLGYVRHVQRIDGYDSDTDCNVEFLVWEVPADDMPDFEPYWDVDFVHPRNLEYVY
jgi:hypothetical protein